MPASATTVELVDSSSCWVAIGPLEVPIVSVSIFERSSARVAFQILVCAMPGHQVPPNERVSSGLVGAELAPVRFGIDPGDTFFQRLGLDTGSRAICNDDDSIMFISGIFSGELEELGRFCTLGRKGCTPNFAQGREQRSNVCGHCSPTTRIRTACI